VKRISAMPSAITAAPPRPWMKRAATSHGSDGDSEHSSEAAVKVATPPMKTRRRPRLSPKAAQGSNAMTRAIW
jgi:hypothetical protein